MPAVDTLPVNVATAAEELRRGRSVLVHGARGSGKSSFLIALSEHLQDDCVLLSPTLGDGDAIEACFVTLADRLAPDAATLTALRDAERPTREKLAILGKLLDERPPRFVLIDDPDSWSHDRPLDRALDLQVELLGLLERSRTTVAFAMRRVPVFFKGESIELPTVPGDAQTHAEQLEWEELQPLAQRIAQHDRSRWMPEWVFRVRVLGELAEAPRSPRVDTRWLRQVFASLRETHPPVADSWSALATLRHLDERSFANRILEALDVPLHRQAVRHCLLAMAPYDDFRLMPVMRKVAMHANGAAAQRQHKELTTFWMQRDTLVGAFETFHHHGRATASERALTEAPPVLLEQLHTFGRWLSMERSYDEAAHVFSVAVARDEWDDYAHHYLAYNLDVSGRDPGRVDEHFCAAIMLNATQPWWHSRYIRFLITRERIDDARSAWDAALAALALDDRDPADQVFSDLHAEVARQLLDALELEFAQDVLDSVPPGAAEEHARLLDLRERLDELRATRDGSPYLPVSSARPNAQEPLLLPLFHEQLGTLRSWWATRIDAVDADVVTLSAEEHQEGRVELIHSSTTIDALRSDGISETAVAPGRLFEIGFYDGERTLALMHAERRVGRWATHTPYPDPMRYVRRSAG